MIFHENLLYSLEKRILLIQYFFLQFGESKNIGKKNIGIGSECHWHKYYIVRKVKAIGKS